MSPRCPPKLSGGSQGKDAQKRATRTRLVSRDTTVTVTPLNVDARARLQRRGALVRVGVVDRSTFAREVGTTPLGTGARSSKNC